jgi:hypothetical protein
MAETPFPFAVPIGGPGNGGCVESKAHSSIGDVSHITP